MEEEKKSSSNSTTVVLCIVFSIIALGIGGFIAVKTLTNTPEESESSTSTGISKEELEKKVLEYDSTKVIKGDKYNGNIDDHARGNADAKVIVVEYADLQCPGCAAMMPNMHNFYAEYGDKVLFIFRNYPISGHKNARSAAAAAEAAGYQGKYWEMLEALYANRAEWISETGDKLTNAYVSLFKEIAPEADEAKFRTDMKDVNITKKLNFDYELGSEKDKVNATPSVYVNGVQVDTADADTVGEFADLIENAIKAALE